MSSVDKMSKKEIKEVLRSLVESMSKDIEDLESVSN